MGMLPGGSELAAAPLGEQAGELPVPRADPKSNVRNLTDTTTSRRRTGPRCWPRRGIRQVRQSPQEAVAERHAVPIRLLIVVNGWEPGIRRGRSARAGRGS